MRRLKCDQSHRILFNSPACVSWVFSLSGDSSTCKLEHWEQRNQEDLGIVYVGYRSEIKPQEPITQNIPFWDATPLATLWSNLLSSCVRVGESESCDGFEAILDHRRDCEGFGSSPILIIKRERKKKEFSIYPRSPEITKRANLTWIKQERVLSEAFSTCLWN